MTFELLLALFLGFVFGVLLSAFLAVQSYERGWRDRDDAVGFGPRLHR